MISIYSFWIKGSLFGWRKRSLFRELQEAGSLRHLLKCGIHLLNPETLAEIRDWLIAQQTKEGGFPDRAGKCDLYYTLFGFFLSEALEADQVLPALKAFAGRTACAEHPAAIDLFCITILNASLFPHDARTRQFAGEVRKIMEERTLPQSEYAPFLIILSLLSVQDYPGAFMALKAFEEKRSGAEKPCTVVAAQQVVACLKTGKTFVVGGVNQPGALDLPEPFRPFYRENGGFAALKQTREPDLLSTAAALYALRFMAYDLRLIRPDCMNFINGLYVDGGFSAVQADTVTDVEYTFYGLLALGALNGGYDQD